MSVCVWKQRNNIFLVWRTEISTAETPSCRKEPMRRKRQKKGNANIIHSIFKRQTHAEVHKIAQITLVVYEFSIFKYKLFFSCGTQTLRAECMLFDVLAVKCGGIRFVVVVVASCATKFGRFVVFFFAKCWSFYSDGNWRMSSGRHQIDDCTRNRCGRHLGIISRKNVDIESIITDMNRTM